MTEEVEESRILGVRMTTRRSVDYMITLYEYGILASALKIYSDAGNLLLVTVCP